MLPKRLLGNLSSDVKVLVRILTRTVGPGLGDPGALPGCRSEATVMGEASRDIFPAEPLASQRGSKDLLLQRLSLLLGDRAPATSPLCPISRALTVAIVSSWT